MKEKLSADFKLAMKNKDTVRKNTIQMVKAAILQVEKDKQITLDDNGVLDVISKQLKQRRDSLPEYEKSGREDLILPLKQEMDILMEYLPEQLTGEVLEKIVKEAVSETGASSMKDMGKIMEYVKSKGMADGKEISQIARTLF